MIVTMTTGSQLDRVLRCPASQALPQVHDANPDEDRDRGTAVHKFLERVAAVGRELALEEVDEQHKALCSDIEIAKLSTQLKLSTEVALAYNWRADTARRLLPIEHRAYEVDPTCEIPLTIDLAGVGADTVHVGDYKGPHAWLPEPEQSMQLGVAALALARVYEATNATVEYVRIRDDGTIRKFGATLDIFSLESAAERVSTAMQVVDELRPLIAAGGVPSVTEGPWCRYCKAKSFCPAKIAIIRQTIALAEAPPYSVAITPENAGEVYVRFHQARAALAQIEGALYAYAKTTAIPIATEADGSERWFGEVTRDGNDVLSGPIVHSVLAEMFGGEAANAAVTMEATKAAVTDVVRKHMPKDAKVTHEVKKVLELVKARGGVTNPPTTSTREFTVSPDGLTRVRKRKAG